MEAPSIGRTTHRVSAPRRCRVKLLVLEPGGLRRCRARPHEVEAGATHLRP